MENLYNEGRELIEKIYNSRLKIFEFKKTILEIQEKINSIRDGQFSLISTERDDESGKYKYTNQETRNAETALRLFTNETYRKLKKECRDLSETTSILEIELERMQNQLNLIQNWL